MGYFCWSSLLNSTIHIAESKFRFTYTVGLGYYRYSDIPLVYSSSLSRTANSLTQGSSLYPTFVVYLTTIYGRLSFIDQPKLVKRIIQSFQRTSGTFSWFVLQSYDFFFILSSTLSTFFWIFFFYFSPLNPLQIYKLFFNWSNFSVKIIIINIPYF